MGVHKEPSIEVYWNKDLKSSPIHTISSHIILSRFQQIKRYLHISCWETDERNNKKNDSIWWHKIEPLAIDFNASFKQYYSPSSSISIDELMV